MDATNPWLLQGLEPAVVKEPTRAPVVIGPVRPQRGIPAPDLVDQLTVRRGDHPAPLWVVGAHGGAAESTLAKLDHAWSAGSHSWPLVADGQPARVVIAARTSARGLLAGKAVAKQWAAGLVRDVELLGLVLVADAPGRLPKPLRDLMKVVSGGYPRIWHVPWVEPWRLGDDPLLDTAPREVRRLVQELHLLTSHTPFPNRKDQNDGHT